MILELEQADQSERYKYLINYMIKCFVQQKLLLSSYLPELHVTVVNTELGQVIVQVRIIARRKGSQ